jgi:hypothetical protein
LLACIGLPCHLLLAYYTHDAASKQHTSYHSATQAAL